MINSSFATIITGGGQGLGSVIAKELAQDSCVLLVGRHKAALVQTCREITSTGQSADYIVGDVAKEATAQKAIAKVIHHGWTLRSLVCNAGIGKSAQTHDLDVAKWRSIIDTNLDGSFHFVKAALPLFLGQNAGTICFMSSLAGVQGYAHEAAYVASKHAVVGLAKSLALEYGKHGIVAVPICPGFIEGSMTTRTIKSLARRQNISETDATAIVARTNPQRRIIPAGEIAKMVRFICQGHAPSLSGHPIILSGGV